MLPFVWLLYGRTCSVALAVFVKSRLPLLLLMLTIKIQFIGERA